MRAVFEIFLVVLAIVLDRVLFIRPRLTYTYSPYCQRNEIQLSSGDKLMISSYNLAIINRGMKSAEKVVIHHSYMPKEANVIQEDIKPTINRANKECDRCWY